jgi:hypothetical protein
MDSMLLVVVVGWAVGMHSVEKAGRTEKLKLKKPKREKRNGGTAVGESRPDASAT